MRAKPRQQEQHKTEHKDQGTKQNVVVQSQQAAIIPSAELELASGAWVHCSSSSLLQGSWEQARPVQQGLLQTALMKLLTSAQTSAPRLELPALHGM